MSEVKSNSSAKVWVPPIFSMTGCLPGDVVTVTANNEKQITELSVGTFPMQPEMK
jgi:hypothetical protein